LARFILMLSAYLRRAFGPSLLLSPRHKDLNRRVEREVTVSEVDEGSVDEAMFALRKAAIQLAAAVSTGDDRKVTIAWDLLSRAMRSAVGETRELVEEEDLVALWDSAADRPLPTLGEREDGQNLLYAGKIHWLAGEPGGGKTWVALLWALEQVRAGKSVLYLDMESDPVTITSRLRTLGIEQEQLSLVKYLRVRWEPVALPSAVEQVCSRVVNHEPSLVVMDGLAQALAQLGRDENSNSDVSAFTNAVLRPIADAGPAVVVVDHMAKPQQGDRGGQTRYARGASAKLADATGVAYLLETITSFSRTKDGLAKLRVGKDRNGAVGAAGETVAEIAFNCADEGMSIVVRKPSPDQGSGRFIPDGVMRKICKELENATGSSMTAGELSAAVGKKLWEGKYRATAVRLLEKYGYVSIEQRGQSKVFTSLQPFSEEDVEPMRIKEFGVEPGKQENPF
jgi:KaiC/GvpD/RAD55 family RecA-like ATPase